MFEGMQEKLTKFGDTIADWVAMDFERGERHERILTHMTQELQALSGAGDREREGTIRSVVVNSDPADGTTVTQVLAKPKQGTTWIVKGIFAAVASAAAARNVTLYLAGGTSETNRPLYSTTVQTAATLEGLISEATASQPEFPLPESLGILARGLSLAAGEVLTLHLIVRELAPIKPKRLERDSKVGAKGSSEGRPSVNKTNFNRPEIPDERGTRTDSAAPATSSRVPGFPPLPDGLNGAPVKVPVPDLGNAGTPHPEAD